MLSQATIRRPTYRQTASCAATTAPPAYLTGPIEMIGAIVPFARNAEIYGENEGVEYLYKVLTGSVRTYKLLRDGRRQIGAFYLPGDVFGFEVGDEHTLSAEAIVDCQLLVLRQTSVAALAARESSVARQLWDMTLIELQRAQDHVMLLVKSARERVAGFLLEMSKRSRGSDEINLPMSRQDIADYLGLTIETVSRSLTQLEHAAAIALPSSRHIILCNRKALSRLNS
jgi:CRP/FNR family transcriptional regulator, nitrogen fixation regulation protein